MARESASETPTRCLACRGKSFARSNNTSRPHPQLDEHIAKARLVAHHDRGAAPALLTSGTHGLNDAADHLVAGRYSVRAF